MRKFRLIEQARSNWIRASIEIGFRINTPFEFEYNHVKHSSFAYLPEYGSKNGTIVDLIFPPSFITNKVIQDWANDCNCYFSFVNIQDFLIYRREYFEEVLNDWNNNKIILQ
jgi:hypothetical protein